MDAIRGLERAVTEIVRRLDDVSRSQADAAREADRAVAGFRSELTQCYVAPSDPGLTSSLDLLRERIFDLSAQIDSAKETASATRPDKALGAIEHRIADALENTAKADDLAQLETRVTERAQATVETAVKAMQRGLQEEMSERIAANETRSADAIKELQTEIINRLEGKSGDDSAPTLGHNGPGLSEMEERIASKFEQMSAQLDYLAKDIDTRIDEMNTETRNEIDTLRERLQGWSGDDGVTGAAPGGTIGDAAIDIPPITDPELEPEPEPEPELETAPHTERTSFSANPNSLREAASRPTETGVHFIDDDKPEGVRASIAMFVIVLLLLSVALIGYSGWRLWSTGQLDLSQAVALIPWLSDSEYRPIETVDRPITPAEEIEPADEVLTSDEGLDTFEEELPGLMSTIEEPIEAAPLEIEDEPSLTATETLAQDLDPAPVIPAQPALITPSARQLHAEALDLYEAGSYTEAADHLRQAAEMGLTIAQFRLATLYEAGQGVTQNLETAQLWYERAANGGNVLAMHNLAILYAEGRLGGTPNYGEAARWFAEAASYDVRDSQFNLAVLFHTGRGVRTDPRQAYLWYTIAERGGDLEAGIQRTALASRLDESVRGRIETAAAVWEPRPFDAEANGQFSVSRPLGPSTAEIARAQYLLSVIGYAPGPADGVMGPRTADSIRDFERSAGMSITGRVTPDLISRLESEVAARNSSG